jgi:hypothetical protein
VKELKMMWPKVVRNADRYLTNSKKTKLVESDATWESEIKELAFCIGGWNGLLHHLLTTE